MRIAEIFASIQGEGIHAGTPSVFIRIGSGRRHWCGEPANSWDPGQPDAPLGAVLSAVRRQWLDHVVLTGTDPMAEDGIGELTEGLRGIDQQITIETAGNVFAEVACDLLSIAAVPGKGDMAILRRLIAAYPYQLKLTVSKREEMEGVSDFLRELEADRRRVVLLAGGATAARMRESALWIVQACRYFGYRYSPHLQLDVAEKKKIR